MITYLFFLFHFVLTKMVIIILTKRKYGFNSGSCIYVLCVCEKCMHSCVIIMEQARQKNFFIIFFLNIQMVCERVYTHTPTRAVIHTHTLTHH